MDAPQTLMWPGLMSVPVLVGLLWWLAPRIKSWWQNYSTNNRLTPHRPDSPLPAPAAPNGPVSPVFEGVHPYPCRIQGSDQWDGSPSPPSSPLCFTPQRGTTSSTAVGSLTPSHPRRLSLRSATLNPSR